MHLFNVTYEIWTPEDVECGDTDERGFVVEDAKLREAFAAIGGYAECADQFPVRSPRWFTNDEYDHDYRNGITEQRSLHIPDGVTPSSRRRIARLLGVRVS